MQATPGTVDVAIVGGGISGLYAGWRLLRARGGDRPHVAVFECSGRTGGRLLTWRPLPQSHPDLNAELGGMRFFRQQALVWNLVDYFVQAEKLQPPSRFFVADPNGNNLWYLRETILKAEDLTNPALLPYRLDARGQYADPASIINNVINSVLMANREAVVRQLGGRSTPLDWHDWDLIKPCLRYRQRRLWDIGFWNLLWDQLSPETYQYVTDAFGYYSLTNNWNAAEAMQVIFSDFTQAPDYHTLREGFDHLPQLVREEFEDLHGEVWLRHRVLAIDRAEEGKYRYRLTIQDEREETTKTAQVLANQVVLAMPRRSLELLRETSVWRPDAVVKVGTQDQELRRCIASVIPYPAFKLFLLYPSCWWRDEPIRIAAGRTISDVPLRQTYYFPSVPQPFSAGQLPPDGPGLVMASYDDLGAVSFWKTLECTPEQQKESDDLMRAALDRHRATAANGGRMHPYHSETQQALIDDRGFFYAPPEMVRHAQEQLTLIHRNRPLPDPRPLPEDPQWFFAAYKDWSIDPFGGGWNFWAPTVEVQATMERMRRPLDGEDIFVIGDAYSGAQGWVEGALTTAEKTLRDHFHLPRAPWQPADCYLGY
jgi:monoamine oxidase